MFHESIRQRVDKLGMKSGDLATIVGMSGSKLSMFFRGRVDLDAAKRDELLQTINDIEALARMFPIPLGVRDSKLLTVALERFRQGKFEQFWNLTSQIDWSVLEVEQQELKRHYPKVWR